LPSRKYQLLKLSGFNSAGSSFAAGIANFVSVSCAETYEAEMFDCVVWLKLIEFEST